MYNKLGLWWSVCHSQRLHIDNKLDYYYYYYKRTPTASRSRDRRWTQEIYTYK
jgi:hypothetical protein